MTDLLTKAEVATLLRVKESVITYWLQTGYIPHVRLGRQVRFRQEAIERWLREQEQEPLISRYKSGLKRH